MAKSKLTPTLQEEFCQIIAGGNTITTACGYCGISTQTYYRWLQEAEEGQQPQVDFCDEVEKARAEAKLLRISQINAAAEGGAWQAAAWFLERSFPDEYSLKQRLEHTGAGGGPVQVVPIFSPDDPLNHINDDNTGDEEDDEADE